MAPSLLRTLVSGTRQMLAAQLFVSVLAVALVGWTLVVTNEVIRERDRLRERVVLLEEELAARGIVAPSGPSVVSSPGSRGYPNEVGPALRQAGSGAEAAAQSNFDPREILDDIFAPAPPLRILVLHARNEADGETAQRLGAELGDAELGVIVNVMPPREPQQSGYVYYDGRQSRAAAALVARFNDAARRAELAQWSAQPRALALPAEGEFTAERVDIVLPPLPEAPASGAGP
ncbi:MAG TPA: hypothetical protein VFO00_07010 [Vitreimonas sp.]|nr:hypothetical protein [Vitreimonas sp.]